MFQIIRIMTLFSVVFWGSCCSAAQRLDSALVGLNGYEEKKDPVECDYRTMEGKLPSQRNGRDSNVFGKNNSEKDDSVFFKCILPLLAGVFGAFLGALIKAWIGERGMPIVKPFFLGSKKLVNISMACFQIVQCLCTNARLL